MRPGLIPEAIPDQFEGCVAGRTLVLDGDGPAYVVAATVKKLDTAIRRFQQEMLTQLFLTRSESVRVHLTASTSKKPGRYNIPAEKPYQGNRESKSKPPLLEPLRQAMRLRENWLPEFDSVQMHFDIEADDAMMQDAYRLKDDAVIWSDDKDLRMTPYPYFEKGTGRVMPGEATGKLWLAYTEAGAGKLLGQGPLFFWAQMLMGDTADNIKGIKKYDGKLCGFSGAYNVLKDVTCVNDAANIVLDGYRAIDQNPLAEGWLLWLLRWQGDNFYNYLKELALTPQNTDFIEDCVRRRWFKDESNECESN